MLLLSLTLLAAAALLLIWAIRGRVVARGRFCRKCRFDLAGLGEAPTCPECGQDLNAGRATKANLRRVVKPGLAAGLMLLVLGLAVGSSRQTGLGAWGARQLSDDMILSMTGRGWDEAFAELIARTNGQRALDPDIWNAAIERGLDHQSDTATPWDRRWGAVLHHAAELDRMSQDQFTRYIMQAVDIDVRLRDPITADQASFPYQWSRAQHRNTSLGFGQVGPNPIAAIVIRERFPESSFSARAAVATIQPINSETDHAADTVINSTFPVPAIDARNPPGSLRLEFNFEIELLANFNRTRRVLGNRTIVKEVRITKDPLQSIELVTDPAILDRAAASISVSPLAVSEPVSTAPPKWPTSNMFAICIRADDLSAPIAARLTIECEGLVSAPSQPFLLREDPDGSATAFVLWYSLVPTETQHGMAVTEAAIRTGKATIRLTPDTDHMLANATIDRFIGLNLVFSDVPIVHGPVPAFDIVMENTSHETRGQLDP